MENKYAELNLANYSLVASKLGLQKSSPVVPEVVTPAVATSTEVIATTSVEVPTTSLPETVVTTTTPVVPVTIETPVIPDKRPTIIITNSTTKSGLASELKNKLSAVGYKIISTGNSRPSLAITTIKVKNSITPDSTYLSEIKKIVKASYDFVVVSLAENASSDIEIIIGGK
jgi:hypothetical protein